MAAMMGEIIHVAAIDDDLMLLEGMHAWFRPVADMELVGTATSVEAYQAAMIDADVVLLDLNLRDHSAPGHNVRRLVATGQRVLVVSVISDTEHVLATLKAGASGYITKDNDLGALAAAIRDVVGGGFVITPELESMHRPTRPRLSPQERAVLTAYARGDTLGAAARHVGVAYGTAKEYLERVKRKYAEAGRPAHTRVDLINRIREDRLELDALGPD